MKDAPDYTRYAAKYSGRIIAASFPVEQRSSDRLSCNLRLIYAFMLLNMFQTERVAAEIAIETMLTAYRGSAFVTPGHGCHAANFIRCSIKQRDLARIVHKSHCSPLSRRGPAFPRMRRCSQDMKGLELSGLGARPSNP